ncbi:hypothetical protein ACFWZ7_25415 [Nocardiopsis alba]|uniref:hypothetical protein n=1 Tax=Nocardiopsis alba TaxID=53437 RepID=UPI00366B0F41
MSRIREQRMDADLVSGALILVPTTAAGGVAVALAVVSPPVGAAVAVAVTALAVGWTAGVVVQADEEARRAPARVRAARLALGPAPAASEAGEGDEDRGVER